MHARRCLAVVASVVTAAVAVVGIALVVGGEALQTIIVGDLAVLAAGLLSVPLLHYWIDGDA